MTDKLIYRLVAPSVRQAACAAVMQAPEGYMVTIAEPTRSTEQNSKLWPMLQDVSRQVDWPNMKMEMVKLSPESWKDMFTASLKKENDMVANLDRNGWVMLGEHTSTMSKRKFSELIELIYAFGSLHNVTWSEVEEVHG